ncbi:MAG: SDR family oxidoreductase [Chloroflexi bacterium]|nr:MAG: SDR family oxidoreductase [Chloroflexota bacterium]
MYDFSGKTFVITGGHGVLGQAMTTALSDCGANIAVLGRRPAMSEALQSRLRQSPGRAIYISTDVLEMEALRAAARQIVDTFGRVDGLVNAAGGNHPQATTDAGTAFFDILPQALRSVLDLNLVGTILPCQVFGKYMAEQGEGVILNVSSMSAFRPLTRIVAYSAAKAGVNNFTRWLAVHMAQNYSPKIRVNAVAPGFFLTEQNRYLLVDEDTGQLTERGQHILAHTPMGRFGHPDDLVGAVLWLLSPASAFVTGIVVPVDGGFSAYSGV